MGNSETMSARGGHRWRIAAWGTAALLLLLPLVAMQLDTGVNWSVGDFIFVALLLGVVGITYELTVRVTGNWAHRAAIVAALAAAVLIVVATGAVGMIGDEGDPYNLLFFGVIGVALVGAIAARFRPAGMAWAMLAAGVAQVALAAGGFTVDPRGAVVSAAFGGLWLLSAALFRMAAAKRTAANG